MGHRLIVERDIETPMRDGTILRSDLYRRDRAVGMPTLLSRTPYGKGFSETSTALFAAEQGYAVVLQDTRGRWNSDGESYPFIHEKEDGLDTINWLAQQPWCNGKVGMFGGSYVGYTQFAAGVMHPPALKTIVPSVAFCDPRAIFYQGGGIALGAAVSWSLLAGAHMAILREPITEAEKLPLWAQLVELVDGMTEGSTFRTMPLEDLPLVGRDGMVHFLADALAHPPLDPFWEQVTCSLDSLHIPALHFGGWYDMFIGHTLRDYGIMLRQGNTEQKVLIGPWVHGSSDGLVGEVDFGLQAAAMMLLPEEIVLRWFDHWLKGAPNGVMEEPPLKLFIMGRNQWRFEQEWPLSRTRYLPFYLHSGGSANSLTGNGLLSQDAPGEEAVDSYVYDPHNPVPTRGGGLCCWYSALPPGAYDQREIEARPDVLVYSTPPLAFDLEVTGPLIVRLWAGSSAPDTDFTAKLVDVGPCGFARNVQDGLVRARYHLPGQGQNLQPGQAYEFTIDLSATSNIFLAGHRIRLEISSSNFPRFGRNPNTGDSIQNRSLVPALQTIFHDAGHPSHILLPVIPGNQG